MLILKNWKKSTNCLRHIPKRQLRKMQICSFNFLTLYGSLCTKKKIFISHSRGFFLLLFKLHNTKNIQRERSKGKVGWAAITKKLKKMKFRVVVLWCSKVVCFCGCSNCRPLCFIFSYYSKPFRSTIHPSISSMLKFAKNTHIFFFQDASMSFRLMCKNASDISKM